MTPTAKEILKRETAPRLRKPFTDSLEYLAKCRNAMHQLDPKDPKDNWSRKQLYLSAKSWVTEARRARFAVEAASPDSSNDRARVA